VAFDFEPLVEAESDPLGPVPPLFFGHEEVLVDVPQLDAVGVGGGVFVGLPPVAGAPVFVGGDGGPAAPDGVGFLVDDAGAGHPFVLITFAVALVRGVDGDEAVAEVRQNGVGGGVEVGVFDCQ